MTATAIEQSVLQLDNVHAYYGRSHVLQGVSLQVKPGEVVSLLGRNGAGKTTTFRSIAGLMPRIEGAVMIGDVRLSGKSADAIARAGVSYVPSGRRSFAGMTVRENLFVALDSRRKKPSVAALEGVFAMFPSLERKQDTLAGVISGGENQMLKMAAAFLTEPAILLLDEPTEGLAPLVVKELQEHIRRLAETGVGILIAEQNAQFALGLSERAYVMNKGRIQMEGSVSDLEQNEEMMAHLGI